MIQNIKREVPETKDNTPVQVQRTDYKETIEYVVTLEKEQPAGEVKTVEKVVVIHDKVTHNNDIMAVETKE